MFSVNRPVVFVALAMMLTILLMAPGLKGDFFFDDNPNIVDNPAIRIAALNIDTLRGSLDGVSAGPLGRPVSVLSFAITYHFFGLDAAAFKTINLIIHLLNGLLLFWLLRLLLRSSHSQLIRYWLPIWAMTIWLIHPINFLPIMLAVQRMTLLSALFMFLALISHLIATTAEKKPTKVILFMVGWLLFWPLSILSKESGLLFPLYLIIILLFENAFSNNEPFLGVVHKNRKSLIVIAVVLLTITGGSFFLLGSHWLDTAYSLRPFSLTQRLMTEARVLWFYTAQIIGPNYSHFAVYHDDFLLSENILNPITTLIAVLAWIGVIGFVVINWTKTPLLCFSLSWFLVGHLLESTFLPLEIMHEHRNYLPSIGLILFVAFAGVSIFRSDTFIKRPKIIIAMALAPIIILGFFTWMRADQLSKPLIGLQIEAAQHPQSARANYSAALALFKAGYGDSNDLKAGEKIKMLFEQSGNVDPNFKLGYIGLISWACASNREVAPLWVQTLSYRLEHTTLDLSERDLPKSLFDTLTYMPNCINREDVDRLFIAGSNNTSMEITQRAYFLEYAADYALFILKDANAAKSYLVQMMTIAPHLTRAKEKLKAVDKLIASGAENSQDK